MKKYLKWFGVALVFYAIFYMGMTILKEQYAPTAGYIKAQNSEEFKNKTLSYTLNNVNLEIPLAYINGRAPKEGKQTGVRLIMTLADMKPLMVPEQNYFNNNEVEKLLRIFIQYSDSYVGLEKAYKFQREAPQGKYYMGEKFELLHFSDKNPESGNGEVYVYPSDENPEIYFRCKRREESALPGCQMHYMHNNFLNIVSFQRSHLQNWKQIKSSSIDLINSFKASSGE